MQNWERSNSAGLTGLALKQKEVLVYEAILLVMAVAALMAAIMMVAALPAFAQQGPPDEAPGCAHFAENAAPHILENPAHEAFLKQLANIGGIGPCFAPHAGGRG